MSSLLVVTALRLEQAALRAAVPGARVVRCGLGPVRAAAFDGWGGVGAVVVAGLAGGLTAAVAPGDVVVASEVQDAAGAVGTPAAAPLVAALRGSGFRVHHAPVLTCDHIVATTERQELAAAGAVAVDMESAPLVRAAQQRGLPVVVVRVVVDAVGAPLRRWGTVPAGLAALTTLHRIGPRLAEWEGTLGPRRVLLAGPRSFCAGVDRAIDIVERALQLYPHPVYVRRQIVHNVHVVRDLQRKGAVFVQELADLPADVARGAAVVLSAHGVAPTVHADARARGLTVVDATCPLVAKVHVEARRALARDDTLLLIGHADHDETEGTLGQAPGRIRLVRDVADVATVDVADTDRVAYVMQTTLAVDEAAGVVDALRQRFPHLTAPPTEDICYATSNRQRAVREIARASDLVLVIGSANSSNSQRLVEVAGREGTRAHLIEDAAAIVPAWLTGAGVVGITAGASAPSHLVDEVVATLRSLGSVDVEERTVVREDVYFAVPKEVAI